ncbi:MAG: hypothetical protein Fur0037_04970 [Planctomycetota bacterium]
MRTAVLFAAACLLPAGSAGAQDGAAAPRLHDAWLREILDLDVQAAASAYSRLSCDTTTPRGERWLATARLLELRRIGVGTTLPAARIEDVPAPLRPSFEKASTERPDLSELIEKAHHLDRGRDELLAEVDRLARGERGPRILRPLVSDTISWLVSTTPSTRQARRELWQKIQVAWRSGRQEQVVSLWRQLRQLGSSRPRMFQRENALQILLRELDGRTSEAERLRRDYFPDWREPRLTNDAETLLSTVLERFPSLLRDARPEEADALRRLEAEIEEAGEEDPAKGLRILQRLPFYAEWLLR